MSERVVMDTSGNVVGRQAHLPFGEDFASSGSQEKHHFTNYERDAESGTDYAINRQYNQSAGRFMRVDPEFGSIGNPQSLNRYAYAHNDAVNLHDPLGLDPIILPPGYGVPEGTCYYFGSYEVCHRGTSENNNSSTGKGRSGIGPGIATVWATPEMENLLQYLQRMGEGCKKFFGGGTLEGVIQLVNQVAAVNGGNAFKVYNYKNAPQKWRDKFNKVNAEFGGKVAGWRPDSELMVILGPAYYKPEGLPSDWASYYAQFGPQWLLMYQGQVLFHEILHARYDASDEKLAKDVLKLGDKGYDVSDLLKASAAIMDFLQNDCQPKKK